MIIKAVGKRNGKKVKVTAEYIGGGLWYIDTDDKKSNADFYAEMMMGHPIGGTYFPEEGSPLYVLAPMHGSWFFDNEDVEITADEYIEELENDGSKY